MELRVFLVEDLLRMRGLLGDLFASMGGLVVVGAASTEAEAKLWLEEHRGEWDVAVIDLVLDQGGGGKVVVFSSYATPGVRTHCLELGADAVFDKSDTAAFISWFSDFTSRENSGP